MKLIKKMKSISKTILLAILPILLIVSLASISASDIASSKIGILVFDGFLTSDVTAPVEVFGAATKKSWFSSYEVMMISATRNKTVLSEEGLKVIADKTIYDDMNLDVLLVPSAYEMDDLLGNGDLIEYIEKQAESASWMASNCSGAFLLGEAGVLDEKEATTWPGGEPALSRTYPTIKVQYDQNVVIDGNVITSNGGLVSYQAAFELLTQLSSDEFSKEISELIQFNRLARAFRP